MHLCEIPEEHITGLEIPNGLPLIFDMKSKCVKVRFAKDREAFCMSRDLRHLPCVYPMIITTALGRWNRPGPIGSL